MQVKLSVATVAVQLLMGLGVALLLNADTPIRRFARSGFLIPMVLPPIVVGIVWQILYAVDVGPFHRLWTAIGLPVGSLITNPDTALMGDRDRRILGMVSLHHADGAGGAADGAGGAGRGGAHRRRQRVADLPLRRLALHPATMLVAGIFRLIDSIKAFPLIFVLTDGGPGDVTEVTNYYAYRQAFNFSLWGYGSAIATLMVIGIFVLSWAIDRLTRAADAEAG